MPFKANTVRDITMHYLYVMLKDKIGLGKMPVRTIEEHLREAAEWLLRGQNAFADDGVAHSYDLRSRHWLASYPETTGYIIPTLYDYAKYFNAPAYRHPAYRMAAWEVDVQLGCGGVMAGRIDAPEVVPTVFNTGQVLFGWARAFNETGEERFLRALRRAADWLVSIQDQDGAWRQYASPFTTTSVNAYNTRSAFGLIRAFVVLADERYLKAAIRNVEWTLRRANGHGWLPDNCLTKSELRHPLTHTIAYSIRGILEVGAAADRQDFIDHALIMAKAVAAHQRPDGSLPARYDSAWQPTVNWSCVTGNSQMAVNWFRLAKLTGEKDLVGTAIKANRFNMSIQDLRATDPGIRGALKGSHPIDGYYMRYKYPNWAAKFFMDGLMLEHLYQVVDDIG